MVVYFSNYRSEFSASEMTYIVSSAALNSTHSLTQVLWVMACMIKYTLKQSVVQLTEKRTAISRQADIEIPVPSISLRAYSFPSLITHTDTQFSLLIRVIQKAANKNPLRFFGIFFSAIACNLKVEFYHHT